MGRVRALSDAGLFSSIIPRFPDREGRSAVVKALELDAEEEAATDMTRRDAMVTRASEKYV